MTELQTLSLHRRCAIARFWAIVALVITAALITACWRYNRGDIGRALAAFLLLAAASLYGIQLSAGRPYPDNARAVFVFTGGNMQAILQDPSQTVPVPLRLVEQLQQDCRSPQLGLNSITVFLCDNVMFNVHGVSAGQVIGDVSVICQRVLTEPDQLTDLIARFPGQREFRDQVPTHVNPVIIGTFQEWIKQQGGPTNQHWDYRSLQQQLIAALSSPRLTSDLRLMTGYQIVNASLDLPLVSTADDPPNPAAG